jgi:hypothetical protein
MPANTTTVCQMASYWTNSGVTSRHHWPAASAAGSRHNASRTCGNGYCNTVSAAVTASTDTVAIGRRRGMRLLTLLCCMASQSPMRRSGSIVTSATLGLRPPVARAPGYLQSGPPNPGASGRQDAQ